MSKLRVTTQVRTKFEDGKAAVQARSGSAGRSAKKHIVHGVGQVAFGIGAAFGAAQSFARGLWS